MHELVIIGSGISGLALAHFADREGIADLRVFESAARPGGKVQTEWIDGFCCEWGPQGFLDNAPDTLELADQLGLAGDLVRADEAASDRFIARNAKLRRVPLSPPAFFTSDVLSLPGKLRVLLEPFQGRGAEEESVLQFAGRRIGREAAEVLVDAMVTGVYAGDPAQLSLPATFPKMRAMEYEHGSLVKAMLAKRRNGKGAGPAGPGGTLTTFSRGMQQLTDTIARRLGARLAVGAVVTGLRRDGAGFAVDLAGGETVTARRVVVAVPPRHAAELLAPLLGETATAALRAIPAVKVAIVMTGYRSRQPFRTPTRGFGFLVPGRERRRILGSIFCDSTFPCQAPAGATLLRTLLGGARDGAVLDLSDDELVALTRRELAAYLGGDPAPDFVRVIRHAYAIPQYTLGHNERLRVIGEALAPHSGVYLMGNGFRGIALNSCVVQARALATALHEPNGAQSRLF